MQIEEKHDLKRVLGRWNLTSLGIGAIIGAGIFVIISFVHKFAGSHTWLSVLFAGLFMSIFSKTYSKLPKIYESDDNIEQKIITNKFNKNISNIILLIAIIGFAAKNLSAPSNAFTA